MAANVGSFAPTCNCQKMNAISMLVAPCARLNTRVVVYVSTNPDAAIAYAAPVNSPVSVNARKAFTRYPPTPELITASQVYG